MKMGKLFGTDGIRGVVNETLTSTLAYRVGQAAALVLGAEKGAGERPLFLIGKDTRISSDMLEAALTAGLCACGADVVSLGVIPTPGVAYLTVFEKADAGIVISASHNPFEYNGIKIFSGAGFKLSDELEDKIEDLILSEGELPVKTGGEIGRVRLGTDESQDYIDYIASTVKGEMIPLKLLVDCANGASSATARRLFAKFPALDVTFFCDEPDGVNINNGCGSTHLDNLSKAVVAGGYDLGVAFDGDADRCLAVDELGREIDGDQIMALCASAMLEEDDLQGNGFVATVMSNMGLHKYAKEKGLTMLCAAVGDRNVLEMMQREGMVLGGEQSGHIIFLNHMTTGDGQLAALHFLSIVSKYGLPASKLTDTIVKYPQVLLNVPAPHDNAAKAAVLDSEELAKGKVEAEKILAGDGRILIRPSGTEALIRVMVEASDPNVAQNVANMLSEIVENIQI
jgi:phosphoglucosamine mutase